MNRRQEIAAWIVGVVLAGISAHHGLEQDEWLFAYFVPVVALGPLVVHSLRDRASPAPSSDQLLKKTLGLVLIVALFGHLKQRADAHDGDSAYGFSESSNTSSRIEELEQKVDELETRLLFAR